MNSLQLGPLILSGERFAIIAGIFIFMIGTGLLATRVSERFNLWSTVVVIAGLAAARLGHVVSNWDYFHSEPLRALAVWQGGFQWVWVIPVVVVTVFTLLKTAKERWWSMVPVGISALVWGVSFSLVSATEPLPAPQIVFEQLDGQPVLLSQSTGQATVVNLWASWCGPCVREMPAFQQAEGRHPDVRFLFINQGEHESKIRDFMAAKGIALKHVLLDPSQALPQHYGTVGLPVTLFLNKDATLHHVHVGEIAPEEIDRQVRRLD